MRIFYKTEYNPKDFNCIIISYENAKYIWVGRSTSTKHAWYGLSTMTINLNKDIFFSWHESNPSAFNFKIYFINEKDFHFIYNNSKTIFDLHKILDCLEKL